jgi:hypothetical protein
MKNAGEAHRPSGVFREVGSAAASWNQYTAWFQAICCKFLKGGEIEAVTVSGALRCFDTAMVVRCEECAKCAVLTDSCRAGI